MGNNTVTIFAIHTNTVKRSDITLLYKAMPKRMERSLRFRQESDRILCVGAGILMMSCVGIQNERELLYGEYGKPFAAGYPNFNISHSGDWCVLALGRDEVGVDIEKLDGLNLEISPTVFTPDERMWLAESPLERFHTLWTLKESVMKAVGLGMMIDPITIDALPLIKGEPITFNGKQWFCRSCVKGEYAVSVCASYPINNTEWIECGLQLS